MVEADQPELDFYLSGQEQMKKFIALSLLLAVSAPALADIPVVVTLKDHKFSPSTIRVKANQPSMIKLINKDASAEEFDSPALKEAADARGCKALAKRACNSACDEDVFL